MRRTFKRWLSAFDGALAAVPPPKALIETDFVAFLMAKDKDFLHQEYVVKGKSAKQIARENGWSHATVAKYLLEFGMPPRSTGLRDYPRGNAPYGARVVGGKLVVHKGEQAIIIQLNEMRSQGASYGDLVAWLNSEQVRTKNDAKKWDRPTVYKILKRAESLTVDSFGDAGG